MATTSVREPVVSLSSMEVAMVTLTGKPRSRTQACRCHRGFRCALVAVALVGAICHLSPSGWTHILSSPRHFGARVIAYRGLLRMTADPEHRSIWNYEIAIEPAPSDEIHIVYAPYAPRIHSGLARKQKQYPGAHLRISPELKRTYSSTASHSRFAEPVLLTE